MNTLFRRSVVQTGIDTIKIKLSNYLGIDQTKSLFSHIMLRLYPQHEEDIAIYQYDGFYNIKDKYENRRIAKVYKIGKSACMVEIFGMCQTKYQFELSDYHCKLLTIIGNLKDVEMTLEKIDVCLDFFYPHSRSYVLDGAKRRDWVALLTYQTSLPLVHFTEMPMTTIRAPITQKKLLRFAKNEPSIKSPDKKKHGDCYYRWVEGIENAYGVAYGPCEKVCSTHFEIKINKRKLYYKLSKLFDGTEAFSSDYDHDTETHIGRKPKQVSIINYDKFARDLKKHGSKVMDEVYNTLIEEIAENEAEYEDLKKTFRDSHSRVEYRFHKPAVTQRQKKSLDLSTETSYETLFQTIEEELKKISIFILKPEVSTDEYLDLYKQRLRKVQSCEQITPDEYGRILEIKLDTLTEHIKTLKGFFNVEPASPIVKTVTTRIQKSKKRSTRKRVIRVF